MEIYWALVVLTDSQLHDILLSLPATIAALGAMVVSIINSLKADRIHKDVHQTRDLVNGRMDELVESAKKEGIVQGKAQATTAELEGRDEKANH